MRKLDFKPLCKLIGVAETFCRKKKPEILAGAALAGVISEAVISVRAGYKIRKILEDKKSENKIEQAKAVAPKLAPVVIFAAGTGFLIVSLYCEGRRREEAWKVLYTTFAKTYSDLKAKDVKFTDESNNYDKIAETEKGKIVIFEEFTGRQYQVEPARYHYAVDRFKTRVNAIGEASMNDWYNYIGIEETSVGYILGIDWGTSPELDIHLIPVQGKDYYILEFTSCGVPQEPYEDYGVEI